MLDVLNKHLELASAATRCSIGEWIDNLDENTKEVFHKIEERKDVVIASLYDDLIESGVELPGKLTTFRSHMKGYCTCQKRR